MAYDATRNEIVYYDALTLQVSTWNGTAWNTRVPPTVPDIDYYYPSCMAFDPSTGRIALAGMRSSYPVLWEWTGIHWVQRVPSVIPTVPGSMATDSQHGRIVTLDGKVLPPTPNHTWTLANGVYTQLVSPYEPAPREGSAMAFDTGRGVCVLFGGRNTYAMGDTWEFDLGPVASYSTFGSGCLGSRGVPHITAQGTSMPRVGSTFTLQANNLPWTGVTFLFLGLSNTAYSGTPLPFNLATLGAPNCSVLCSGDQLQVMSTVLGSGSWSWQVPPLPGLTFYNQAFALDPTTNALGLVTSNAGTGIIGL